MKYVRMYPLNNKKRVPTYRGRIDACYNGVSFITFADRIMIDAQFLGNEVNDSSLFGAEGPGKGEFISHAIILEEENPRVDVKGRGIVKVEFI